MKRIYISGAITGKTNYMEQFNEAEEALKKGGYSVINPAKIGSNMPKDTSYEEYMDMSIMLLNMCDAIFMLEGWQQSKGANREYGYALAKDMIIIS